MRALILTILLLLPLTACERLGIVDPAKEAAMRDEEGKAIGGACRQSGRALEDCFTLNSGANKASVFNGWKDMNDYMTTNKIEIVKPELPVAGMLPKRRNAEPEGASEASAEQSPAVEETPAERRRAARKKRQAEAAAAEAPEKQEKPVRAEKH